MIPRRVTLSGFLSYREEVTFDFTDHTLWMLSGDNGAGKSSVFDAITFALYGEHRGGRQGATDLINSRSDRFSVAFEFQVGAERYLAKRTIPRKGAVTRLISRWDDAAWQPIPGTSQEGGCGGCIRQIVGLNYEAFISSVLLRQGKGDRFLDAPIAERFGLLSQIVDLSRYEELYRKADAKRSEFKALAEEASRRLSMLTVVTDAQITEAKSAVISAQHAECKAQTCWTELVALVGVAGQWERLTENVQALQAKIGDADKLIADRDTVIAEAARHGELEAVIPFLDRLHDARSRKQEAEQKDAKARSKVAALVAEHARYDTAVDPGLTPERQADWLEQRIKDKLAALQNAKDAKPYLQIISDKRGSARVSRDSIASLQRQVRTDSQRRTTIEEGCPEQVRIRNGARAAENQAQRQHADAVANVNEITQRLQRLEQAKQESGEIAKCLYCDQPLSEAQYLTLHAKLTGERMTFIEREQTTSVRLKQCENDLEAAEQGLQRAWERRLEWWGDQDGLRNQIAAEEQRLSDARIDARNAADHLADGCYAEKARSLFERTDFYAWLPEDAFPTDMELAAVKENADAFSAWEAKATNLSAARTQMTITAAALQMQAAVVAAAEKSLPAEWLHWFGDQSTETDPVLTLKDERSSLADAPQKKIRLDEAIRDRDHWRKDEERDERLIAEIPERARRLKQTVESDTAAAKTAWEQEKSVLDAAKEAVRALSDHKKTYDETLATLTVNRRRQEIYKVLTDLLGPENLQRSLLRGAEDAITDYANATLSEFSHGTLRLQPRADGEGRGGKDSTLDLLCVNTDVAEGSALPLSNLSGSQRFRVAVALALGIGRFASRNDALIESVIIDEGFGSLDRQNRQDMADTIRSLADDQSLKRIIVVSHDELFANSFTNRIHVAVGSNGSQIVEQPLT